MLTMEEYLKSTGFIGHKIDAYGGVDHVNQNYLIWAVQLFGTCGIGVNLPAWAETAFDAGEPWGDPPEGADTSIVGGHYFPLVDYRNGWFKCVTWGAIQPVNMDFLKRYADEAFAAADFDWIAAVGVAPSGFDLAQLAADLASIA